MSEDLHGPVMEDGMIREKVVIVLDCYRDPKRWTREDVLANTPNWVGSALGVVAAISESSDDPKFKSTLNQPLYYFDDPTVYCSLDDLDGDRAQSEDHFEPENDSSWLPPVKSEHRRALPHFISFVPRGWYLQQVDYTTLDRRLRDTCAGSWLFLVRDDITDVDAALRVACRSWAWKKHTEAHRLGEFWPEHPQNWGDFINDVEPEILLKHGLVFVNLVRGQGILVDHDETLVPVLPEA